MSLAPDPPAPPDPPRGLLDKLGAALPVALTALATVFASLSNGALQEAMYWKSQAAQDQSKAANQWSLAGFKRDRALVMLAAVAQLRAQCGYAAPRFALPPGAAGEAQKALGWLTDKGDAGGPPVVRLPEVGDPTIEELRAGIEGREPERDLLKRAARVPHAAINRALDDAEKFVERTDRDWDPVVRAAGALVRAQLEVPPDAAPERRAAATAAQAAGFDLEERRYRLEARLNQGLAFLYEIRTRVSAAESDRHRQKSTVLSYAMLVAQVGAVASSLALARKQKSAMWLFAGVVGLISVGVGGYALLPASLLPF